MDVPSPDNDSDPLCGKEVAGGRYVVERVLGKGGMGTVYLALQRPINRKVALKLIHRELVGNAELVGRFMQEMRVTATIEHPHTVRLYDFGDLDGQPFLTTEFLVGRTLRVELAAAGAFSQQRLCNVGIQIAKALRAAHEQGVIHRDLKPDNVMLLESYGERDYVKVLDFGIARLLTTQKSDLHTRTGMLLGTPAYMSPEQCEGKPVDIRSDLYSLGVVLFELATGSAPFPADNTVPQLLMAHVATPPPDIRTLARALDEAIAQLIMTLLAKRPEDRPASAAEIVAAFAPFAQGTVGAPPVPSPATARVAAPPPRTEVLPNPASGAVSDSVEPAPDDVQVTPTRHRGLAFAILFAALAGASIVVFLIVGRKATVSPDAIAAAMSLPGEPPYPVECVSAHGRDRILAAASGRASWSSVPAESTERRLSEARAKDVLDEEGRGRLDAVVRACPSSSIARTLLGKILAHHDEDDAAIAQFEAAVALAPTYVPARFGLAVALVKQGDSARAMPLVTAVLADEPQHAGARLLRGQSRMAAGDVKGAIDDFKAHTDANPQAGTVWAMLGEALAQSGDATASKAAFCRAADLGVERAQSRCPRR